MLFVDESENVPTAARSSRLKAPNLMLLQVSLEPHKHMFIEY
jgi:hypothetical protein